MPKRWLFHVFGAGAPVCISLASIVPILVRILPLVLVLWESAPLALVLHIGPVLITTTPAVPVYATLEPASLLARLGVSLSVLHLHVWISLLQRETRLE